MLPGPSTGAYFLVAIAIAELPSRRLHAPDHRRLRAQNGGISLRMRRNCLAQSLSAQCLVRMHSRPPSPCTHAQITTFNCTHEQMTATALDACAEHCYLRVHMHD